MKTYKPTSPGRRGMTGFDFTELTPNKAPEKSLLEPSHSTGGRNNYGRITSRFKGGGHKQRYRVIDFKREKTGVPAKVVSIEYDPNRRPRQRAVGQGRPHALDGSAPAQPRRHHEPRRSPDGWWRRSQLGWSPSLLAVGHADQGLQDAYEQEDGEVHCPSSWRKGL